MKNNMMYKELVARLRDRARREDAYYEHGGDIINEAADAIEGLSGLVEHYGGETGIKDMQEFAGKYWDTLAKIPRWIPVTKKLPEKDGPCLCWLTYTVYPNPGPGETRVCYDVVHFDVKSKSWFLGFKYQRSPKVLAWMRLPEPPKEVHTNV